MEAVRKVCVFTTHTARYLLCDECKHRSMQACDPREFLLFLPQLASILGDATEYMHQCAVMLAGKEGAEGSPELSPLKEQNLSTSCQHTMTDILNHSISEAAAAFQGLKRRNSRFVMDVLMFIRSAVEAKVFSNALYCYCRC